MFFKTIKLEYPNEQIQTAKRKDELFSKVICRGWENEEEPAKKTEKEEPLRVGRESQEDVLCRTPKEDSVTRRE